jgi:hypothetical protein
MNQRPEGSKISRYETLKQVEKSTGKTPPELINAPSLRAELTNLWDAYGSMVEYTYTELKHYGELTGNQLDAWEVSAIIKLAKYR